jgi:hypothetical protein
VGRALTEWEQVENACAQLFAIFVSATQRRAYQAPAVRAYGCIIGVKSRSTMLREAARAYFYRRKTKAQFEKNVGGLIKEYMAYSDRRNEIAHGCVMKFFVTEKHAKRGQRHGAIGLYLAPSFYNPKKFKNEAFTHRYTSSDLIHYRQEFTKLALRIGGLYEKINDAKASRS